MVSRIAWIYFELQWFISNCNGLFQITMVYLELQWFISNYNGLFRIAMVYFELLQIFSNCFVFLQMKRSNYTSFQLTGNRGPELLGVQIDESSFELVPAHSRGANEHYRSGEPGPGVQTGHFFVSRHLGPKNGRMEYKNLYSPDKNS